MKAHCWTETLAPDYSFGTDGSLYFYSHPDLYNYLVGDVIEYRTLLGISRFEITFVEKANLDEYDSALQRITAKKID